MAEKSRYMNEEELWACVNLHKDGQSNKKIGKKLGKHCKINGHLVIFLHNTYHHIIFLKSMINNVFLYIFFTRKIYTINSVYIHNFVRYIYVIFDKLAISSKKRFKKVTPLLSCKSSISY